MDKVQENIKYPHTYDMVMYAEAILAGEIVAGKLARQACERFCADLERWSGEDSEFVFVPSKVEDVCSFIENLPHIKGEWANNKEKLVLSPWQKFILGNAFGWINRETGYRRFKTVYIEVPRKNGKSTFSAGVALYMLCADGEAGAEVYSAATTADQAKIVFTDARNMCQREGDLRNEFGLQVNVHALSIAETSASFKPLSAEANSLDGLNIHCAVIDELHAHKTRQVFDVVETSMGSRTQPLLWLITTAGSNQAGICYEQRSYVEKILNGTTKDETYFGIIYTVDEGDDWRNPLIWEKANPNYGVSVYPHDLKRLADKAMTMASAQNGFLTKRLNVWVNAATSWMDMIAWARCADPALRIEDFQEIEGVIGLDLASKIDVTSKVYLFSREHPKEEGGEATETHYYAFAKHYLPADRVHSEAHAKTAHFAGWALEGWVTLTPGNMIDLDFVEQEIRADLSANVIRTIGYDPWQATQMAGRLLEEGAPMVEVRPTVMNFSDPMKMIEALVLAGRFHHNGDPCLSWMISNVVCFRDNKDNVFPRKEQEQNKIDGAVALITAMNRMLAVEEEGPSVYEERGLLYV